MDVLSRGRRRLSIVAAATLWAATCNPSNVLAQTPQMWRPPALGPPVRNSQREFAEPPIPWKDLKTRNIVLQQRDYSCGAAALATLLRYYWGEPIEEIDVLKVIEGLLTPEELRDRVENGLSITDLRRTAVKLGFQSAIGTMTVEKLLESKVPVIVALDQNKFNHFVVVRAFSGGYAYLADPIRGNVRITLAEFSKQWIKSTLLVVIRPGQTQSAVSQLAIYPGETDPAYLNRQVLRTRVDKVLWNW